MKSFHSYKNPSLATDLVVFGYAQRQLSVLLLYRKEAPFKDQWTLPGAFLQMEETFDDLCLRVLQSKLGIGQVYLEQLYTFDAPARDPRGRVVTTTYYALVNPAEFSIVSGKLANDARWFSVNELPDLGFDHAEIFRMALQRLRSKMLYNPVGFGLLNEDFTIPEVHQLYECVLDVSIDRRNFSRKMLDSGYLLPTGRKRQGSKNRHPDLYRFSKGMKPNSFYLNLHVN